MTVTKAQIDALFADLNTIKSVLSEAAGKKEVLLQQAASLTEDMNKLGVTPEKAEETLKLWEQQISEDYTKAKQILEEIKTTIAKAK